MYLTHDMVAVHILLPAEIRVRNTPDAGAIMDIIKLMLTSINFSHFISASINLCQSLVTSVYRNKLDWNESDWIR